MVFLEYLAVLGGALLALVFLGTLAGVAILCARTVWRWGRK